jgi:hypothetical protein
MTYVEWLLFSVIAFQAIVLSVWLLYVRKEISNEKKTKLH